MKKQRKNAGSILRMAVALSLAATLLPLPAYAKTHYEGTHSSPNEARGTLEDLETSLRQPPDSEQLFKDARSDAREQSDSSNISESNATDDDPEEESPDSVSQEDAEAANEATTAQENERTTRLHISIDDDEDNVDEGDDQDEDETENHLVLLVVTATGIALIAAIFNYSAKRKKSD